MKFYCISDDDTARGFSLAGVDARVAATPEEARAVFDDVAFRYDCGIVIITEKVAGWIRPQVEMIRLVRELPLIVEIPGPEGPLSDRKSLRELVQEAVGISVG